MLLVGSWLLVSRIYHGHIPKYTWCVTTTDQFEIVQLKKSVAS